MAEETDVKKQQMEKQPVGKGARYSEEQKKQLLEKYNELCKQGKNVVEAAKEVGVSYVTLRKWEGKKSSRGQRGVKKNADKTSALEKALKPREERAAKKKSVQKKKASSSKNTTKKQGGTLVLVTPRGYRIEGISASDLIKVLKELK